MTRSKRRSPSPHRSERKRSQTAAAAARRGGRPSHVQAEKLGVRILDVATELFLAHG